MKDAIHTFKRTALVRFVRGLFFDGSTVKRAEPKVWEFISRNVGESKGTCVDVGANRGEYSCLMAQKVGKKGMVYAFELHPENVQVLRSNIWRYRKCIKVEHLAVTNGKTEFVGAFPGRNRSGAEWNIMGHSETERGKPEFSVRATSLDKYFQPGTKIDLIKVDVEGAGKQVLEGMERILQESQPLIVFEVHNQAEWEGLRHLNGVGYTLCGVQGETLLTIEGFGIHCVAVPKGRKVIFCLPT